MRIKTEIVGERRVKMTLSSGDPRDRDTVEFKVEFNPVWPSGHPARYRGIPEFDPNVQVAIKAAARGALAS